MTAPHLISMGKRVHALTRKFEQGQLCNRKTVVTVAYRRFAGAYEEIGHWVNHPLNHDQSRCSDRVGDCGCTHSEPQAICDILRNGSHLRGGDLILAVTYSPCTPCANIIAASKVISEVWWLENTKHDMRGIDVLENSVRKADLIAP